LSARVSAHAEWAGAREVAGRRWAERGGEVASAGRERPRVWARNRPSQGGKVSFFISNL
jgi:hypothetical protein